jgi:hypothetical protein
VQLKIFSEEIILHQFKSIKPDRDFEEILYFTAGVELTKAGFTSTRISDSANFLLKIEYKLEEQKAEVSFSLYPVKDPAKVLAEQEETFPLDYSLEERISSVVRTLIQQAGLSPKPNEEAKIEGILPELIVPEIIWPAEPYVEVSLGGGGIVLLGEVTDYIHYGVTGALTADIMIPKKSWSIALGVRATFSRMFNNSDVSGGPLGISTIGPTVQLGISLKKLFHAGISISGGAAVLSILGDGKSLHKTVPYADAGVYFQFPIGKGFFAGSDVRYTAVFDPDVLIMGISPVFFLGRRL